jgi:hypothetical protein
MGIDKVDPIVGKPGFVLLHVHVQPKASRNAVTTNPDAPIRIALTAQPIDGAANKALIAFLSEELGVPKRAISLIKGEKSKEKTLRITGLDLETVKQKMGVNT